MLPWFAPGPTLKWDDFARYRLMSLGSGLSPAIPLVLLFLAVCWWIFLRLKKIDFLHGAVTEFVKVMSRESRGLDVMRNILPFRADRDWIRDSLIKCLAMLPML